jgi:hypothetical protein
MVVTSKAASLLMLLSVPGIVETPVGSTPSAAGPLFTLRRESTDSSG